MVILCCGVLVSRLSNLVFVSFAMNIHTAYLHIPCLDADLREFGAVCHRASNGLHEMGSYPGSIATFDRRLMSGISGGET